METKPIDARLNNKTNTKIEVEKCIMNLVIPVESKSLDAPVCPSFGRCPYYVLLNTQEGTNEFLDNAAASSQGGAGIRASQMLVDRGTNAVITHRCGTNAAQVLNGASIDMYLAQEGTVAENIALFQAGKLSLLTQTHPGFHNHGGGKQ